MYKKIFLSLFLILCFITQISAQSIDDMKKRKEEINNQMEINKANLESLLAQKTDIEAEIVATDIKLEEINSQIQIIELDLEEANNNLDVSEVELAGLEVERDTQQEVLENRLRNMYEYGDTSYLNAIFSAHSFRDLLNRTQYIKYVNEYDNKIYDEYLLSIEKVEEKITEIDEQIEKIEILQEEANESKAQLETEIANKKVLLAKVEEDEAANQASIEQLESEEAQVQQLIKEAEEAAKKAAEEAAAKAQQAQQQASFKYTGGKFGWPVPSVSRISSYYGYRIHPIFGTKKLHAGIDIPSGTGTDVVAAESGTVTAARYMSGYGYTVIINHGGGYSTLYGHNSKLLVSTGDSVKKGQHIAEMGSTGNSTGPHCHFEVRINGATTNPLPYLQ